MLEKAAREVKGRQICPSTNKVCYKNHAEARFVIERKKKRKGSWTNWRIEERSYRCQQCKKIHITHSLEVSTKTMKRKNLQGRADWKRDIQDNLEPYAGLL